MITLWRCVVTRKVTVTSSTSQPPRPMPQVASRAHLWPVACDILILGCHRPHQHQQQPQHTASGVPSLTLKPYGLGVLRFLC
jgi:hypothetical protein